LSRAILAFALLAGCYSPSVDRCLYRCDTGGKCPSNLTCNSESWCAESEVDSCSGAVPDASSACTWQTSNIDACVEGFDKITADWSIPSTLMATVDTTNMTANAPAGAVVGTMNQGGLANAPALVIAVHDFRLDGTLTVSGKIPLIIVASGTVTIGGTLRVTPAGDIDVQCSGQKGGIPTGSNDGGGGGGGGSMGLPGGPGGLGGLNTTSMGTAASRGSTGMVLTPNELMLTPLRGGCRGGNGGNPNGGMTGRGGSGGGAVQISAQTTIIVMGGTIAANGAGGLAPAASASGQNGGGGGGSGGAILLESPMVTVSNARICANGGGGASSTGDNGGVSDCGTTPAPGGQTNTAFDGGANGSTAEIPSMPAEDGASATGSAKAHGGGGGGGGVGRFRILGDATITSSIVSPTP